jgi:diadenosine tetraphosphatase ApaH/serine/threonine PP2A family protein phosphatase
MASCDILAHFQKQLAPMLSLLPEEIHKVGARIPIPSFDVHQIRGLIDAAAPILQDDCKPVLDLPLPAWVIGDIHGNFHDLLRILSMIGSETSDPIVFLGDYVDRGTYSIEVVITLLMLKCLYPHQYFLIRGNHEFATVNGEYGFKEEIDTRYPGTDLWNAFNSLFSLFPFATVLGKSIVSLHGGIGPQVHSLTTIRNLNMPVLSFEGSDIVDAIVWSDPTAETSGFVTSARGCGYAFGAVSLVEFLKESGCKMLIRAHQCLQYGIETFAYGHGLTVFSSSNYAGRGNSAAFVFVRADFSIEHRILEPLPGVIPRQQARYNSVTPTTQGVFGPRTKLALARMVPITKSKGIFPTMSYRFKPGPGALIRKISLRELGVGCYSARPESSSLSILCSAQAETQTVGPRS